MPSSRRTSAPQAALESTPAVLSISRIPGQPQCCSMKREEALRSARSTRQGCPPAAAAAGEHPTGTPPRPYHNCTLCTACAPAFTRVSRRTARVVRGRSSGRRQGAYLHTEHFTNQSLGHACLRSMHAPPAPPSPLHPPPAPTPSCQAARCCVPTASRLSYQRHVINSNPYSNQALHLNEPVSDTSNSSMPFLAAAAGAQFQDWLCLIRGPGQLHAAICKYANVHAIRFPTSNTWIAGYHTQLAHTELQMPLPAQGAGTDASPCSSLHTCGSTLIAGARQRVAWCVPMPATSAPKPVPSSCKSLLVSTYGTRVLWPCPFACAVCDAFSPICGRQQHPSSHHPVPSSPVPATLPRGPQALSATPVRGTHACSSQGAPCLHMTQPACPL